MRDMRSRRVNIIHLNCGLTNSYPDGYSESDFFPNYASYNSILFEGSCILTLWEHMYQLFDDSPIMLLHTDVQAMHRITKVVDLVSELDSFVCGITIPSYAADNYNDLVIADTDKYRCSMDPWRILQFDGVVDIWELIKIIDHEAWEFAMDTDPVMIYSHQFVASRDIFDKLGRKLCELVTQLRLGQCGLWTPHVFERIIAIRLAMEVEPVLLAAFSHQSSSGPKGNGALTLYGPRSYKFLQLNSRMLSPTD